MTDFVALDFDKLAAAKMWLTSTPTSTSAAVGDAPYLSLAVYALVTVSCDEVESISADEHWRLYVNPRWLDQATVRTVAAEIAHAALHLLMDHAGRARSMQVGSREADAWRTAADTGVADQLARMSLPPVVARTTDARLLGNLSTEERFAVLNRLDVPPPGQSSEDGTDLHGECACGSAADGRTRGFELPADADSGGVDRVAADQIRKAVAIAYQGWRDDRQPGIEPGEWARFVTSTLDPVVPWQQVLSSAVRRAVGWTSGLVDYSYARPSRRQAAVRSIVLPGMRRPQPDAVIAVDTSGSVDDGLLAQALAEVSGALSACGTADSSVRVLSVDAAVNAVQRVRKASDVRLVGGGGTDMGVGIAAAAELRPRPDVVIVLTDGETPWPPAPPPGVVVIVAMLGRTRAELPSTPTWATRIECIK